MSKTKSRARIIIYHNNPLLNETDYNSLVTTDVFCKLLKKHTCNPEDVFLFCPHVLTPTDIAHCFVRLESQSDTGGNKKNLFYADLKKHISAYFRSKYPATRLSFTFEPVEHNKNNPDYF